MSDALTDEARTRAEQKYRPGTEQWDYFQTREDERTAYVAGYVDGATRLDRDTLARVLDEHTIECTGPGEVTCRGCRDRSWMSWTAYREHVADAVLAALTTPTQQNGETHA